VKARADFHKTMQLTEVDEMAVRFKSLLKSFAAEKDGHDALRKAGIVLDYNAAAYGSGRNGCAFQEFAEVVRCGEGWSRRLEEGGYCAGLQCCSLRKWTKWLCISRVC
jgi:hypothetical protein